MRIQSRTASALVAAAMLLIGFVPVGGGATESHAPVRAPGFDLSQWSNAPPGRPLRFLFIHHSCGGQWLATPGQRAGDDASCIFQAHPNGGGLRAALEHDGYEVYEASYGSSIGADTDLFHWLPKFRDRMNVVLSTRHQDETHADGKHNQIVAFKSCYPNNEYVGVGDPPGSPRGPALTVWNAKAALSALLPLFAAQPQVLFVYVTPPPIAPRARSSPAWKWLARAALRRPQPSEELARRAALAREVNDWVRSPRGWLKDYELKNVAVFDYYDVLTGSEGNLSAFASKDGRDSHPSSEGNRLASERFVPFLNQAVRRAGLIDSGDRAVRGSLP